jgi:hypothetical protein
LISSLSTGWTLQQFGFVVCIITTTHFAAEAYPSNPGPALVLVVGAKNIVSFGKFLAWYPALPSCTSLSQLQSMRWSATNHSIDQSTKEETNMSLSILLHEKENVKGEMES